MKGSFSRRLGEICGDKVAPSIFARSLRNAEIVATRIVAFPAREKLPPLPVEDAFVAAVAFKEGYTREFWLDGRALSSQPPQPAFSVSLMDLRHANEARFECPLDSVHFHFPRRALHAIANMNGLSHMHDIQSTIGILQVDPITAQLAMALKPAFLKLEEVSQLFLDHVMTAAAIHMMTLHGGVRALPLKARGGLAPWQQRRVEELIEANLSGALSLADLASRCGISQRHFTRAFTQSNGMPPHKWLLQRRTEKAKELLRSSELSLGEIARVSGFSSQSHLTRIFTQSVGQSPGAWRRMCRF
jgi:AraC family transcriptional regulator